MDSSKSCPGWDSNPHAPEGAGGFKPPPSTGSGTRACSDATPARMPGMRGSAPAVLVATAALLAFAAPAVAATDFGHARRISSPYAWNPGKSLVATTNKLLTIFASDCPPPSGRCADDNGPRMGVFVR